MDAVKFIEERDRMCKVLIIHVICVRGVLLLMFIAQLVLRQRWTLRSKLLWLRNGRNSILYQLNTKSGRRN